MQYENVFFIQHNKKGQLIWYEYFPIPILKNAEFGKSDQNSKTEILSQRISDSIAAWEKSIYYNMIWNNTLAMNAVINHKIKYYM